MIPFLIGAALSYGSQLQAQHRREQLQKAMQSYQQSKALQNEGEIRGLIAQQTPDARAKGMADTIASRAASAQGTVNTVNAGAPQTVVAGASSIPDYQRASAAAADTVADRTKRAIEQLSTMGAPGEQALASSIGFGRTAGKVNAGNAAISNVGNAYMDEINQAVPNPLATTVGSGLMAFDAPRGAKPAAGGAQAMGANKAGNYTYEDSAGNTQQSAFPYKKPSRWPSTWTWR